jgi:CHAT domain-containing protein
MMIAMRGWASALLVVSLALAVLPPSTAEAQRPGRGNRGGSQPPPKVAPSDDGPDHAGPYGFNSPEVIQAVERGEGPQALQAYEAAAAEAEKAGALGTAVRAGAAACMVAWRLGMVQKTLALGTHVIKLAPNAPPSVQVSAAALVAYTLLGRLYRSVGDLPQARRLLDEAVTLSRSGALSSGGPGLAAPKSLVLVVLSQVEAAQGERAGALAHAQEAVQLLESTEGQHVRERVRTNLRRKTADAYLQLARVAIADKRLDAAAAALAKAAQYAALVKIAEQEAEIALLAAQVALDRGDAAGALMLATKARAEAERLGMSAKLGELDRLIAYASFKLGKVDEALAAARSALARIEETRSDLQDPALRAGFLEQRQGLYHFAVHMALRAGKPEEGFAIAERSRSRAFLDLLGNATLSKGKTRALAQEEMRLRARLAEAAALVQAGDDDGDGSGATNAGRERMAAAERDYRAFLERVRGENVEQASLMSVEPVTLAEIQAILPADAMLLEYLVSPQDVVLWVVDRHHVEVRRIAGDRAALLADVRDFRAAIANQAPLPEVETRAQALYRKLLAPAHLAIRGRRLVIVPHDVLHYLPFGALRTPAGKWLIEVHALATVPSASVLKFLADKGTHASDRILAVGNPDLGPALALRYAEREVRIVGEHYPATSTVLTQADASESRVKQLAGGAGLLHFAVHGELDPTDPMASALLLAPGQGEDGRLEVRELFAMELDARLVVLSACETGLGKLSRGDELVGLQRAFLYAGTPDVVTTLWKVDDRASYLLMRAFYEALPTKGPMEALRVAQRALMVDFPHPFAWAAFGLTGAPH